MNLENARKIVLYAVETTEPVWSSYNVHWDDMDKVFLSRAYEQGGFENWKFISVLDKYQIASIGKVGKILDKYNGIKKYNRELAGSLDAPIYKDMKKGTYGLEGKEFYYSVKEFLSGKGRAGRSFFQLLWWMLICCNYLKNNYNGSFSYYLKKKFSEFRGSADISDEKFENISVEEWEEFLKKSKPWKELYGV